MATDILLVREGYKLGADNPISAEFIASMKHGEVVMATIRRPRNVRHHRMFMAIVQAVFENQTRYATFNQVLNAVKIGCGYYDLFTLPGKIPVQVCVPKSLAFGNMPQDEFDQFYAKAVSYVLAELLPGVRREDLEARILEIAAGRNGLTTNQGG